jgi:hypothetical protein
MQRTLGDEPDDDPTGAHPARVRPTASIAMTGLRRIGIRRSRKTTMTVTECGPSARRGETGPRAADG